MQKFCLTHIQRSVYDLLLLFPVGSQEENHDRSGISLGLHLCSWRWARNILSCDILP